MDIEQQIRELENKLTGNLLQDMETRNKIHNLKMKLNNVKPMDSHIDCVGCGA